MEFNDRPQVVWERACAALVWLVREEYPDQYTLAEIAEKWGYPEVTPEQVEALRQLENSFSAEDTIRAR